MATLTAKGFTAAQQRLLGQQFLFHQPSVLQTNRDLLAGLQDIGQPLGFGSTPHPQAEGWTAIRRGR